MRLLRLASVLLVLASAATQAQESLDTILDRGYVVQWLVCGPFEPDAEGGILKALEAGLPPLGDTDFMAPLGGIARTRPKHLLGVEKNGGEPALWQRAQGDAFSLDLSPFFPDAAEGVSYAAFYAQTDERRTFYADLQTPLGARLYLNGFPLRDVHFAPVTATGADRFLLTFRRGLNLLVMEIPGATYETLARAAGLTTAQLKATGFENRPLLQGKSGYEIALRLEPLRELGGLNFVPKLESPGTFTGTKGDIRQDLLLTLYNPQSVPSRFLGLRVDVPGSPGPTEQIIPPIAPETRRQVRFAVPTGDTAPGQSLAVSVELTLGEDTAAFSASVNVLSPAQPGTVYVLTGARLRGTAAEDQNSRVRRHLSQFARQFALLQREPHYGFDLGELGLWRPALDTHPQFREDLSRAVARAACAAAPGYGMPDERIVGGEILIRNLLYGHAAGNALLNGWNAAYVAWDPPAMAPQSPQILGGAGIAGIVTNLSQPGIPELAYRLAPDGTRLLHRRKESSPPPASSDGLRRNAALQRRELLDRGFQTDLLVTESTTAPPEPFWLRDSALLARSVPAIVASGAGAREFLEETQSELRYTPGDIPTSARALTAYQLGSMVTQPDIKAAHASLENLLLTTEKLATFAALLGADYPETAIDLAWRQLLYCSDPSRLGHAATPVIYLDTLAAYREAAEYTAKTLGNATQYIARQVDTYSQAPSQEDGILALVVFNPSSWERTGLCETILSLDEAAGITLLDEAGEKVPNIADRLHVVNTRIAGARLTFVASGVPALGYKTYYIVPRGGLPNPIRGEGVQIENEFIRIIVDPERGGAIASFLDKRSSTERAAGLWNDVLALTEDPSENGQGRDLWTTGDRQRASARAATVELTRTQGVERLTVTAPFLGGRLVREMTLYQGIPKVFCETRLENADLNDTLLAVTFITEATGQVPVFGERFGALVGRAGPEPLTFRTRERENPSGTGAQPAYRWTALSPNDHLRAGAGIAVPLGPAAIVHGREEILRRVADEIQAALIGRGIPADTWPDVTRRLDPVWTDSTQFPNHNDDLDHGTAFRIVLGSPEHNRFTKRLFPQLSEEEIADFSERMIEGGALFFLDRDVPEGRPPVPTLILAGLTLPKTADLAEAFAESIATDGIYHLPPQAYIPSEGKPLPTEGVALLHKGAALASVESDGTLVLFLAHASPWTGDAGPSLPEAPANLTYRYALYPFSATWREAGVARQGHEYNEALVGVLTGLHLGAHPPAQSFLEATPANFIVTSVRPAGSRLAALRSDTLHPREGLAVRGYESHGRSALVRLTLFAKVYAAAESNVLDQPGDSLEIEGNQVYFQARPCGIATLWLQPSSRIDRGRPEDLDTLVDPYGPVFTRYWRHNTGAAPLGFQPLSLFLNGGFGPGQGPLEVLVANNLVDEPIEGHILLSAPDGWNLAPNQIPYQLSPGQFARTEVLLLRNETAAPTGGIVARTRHAGRIYQDLLDLDEAPLELELLRRGDEIHVTVKNKGALPAEGFLDLVVPTAHWPEWGAQASAITVYPRRAAVYVSPFQEQRLLFRSSGDLPTFWIIAKLAANGHLLYRKVPE